MMYFVRQKKSRRAVRVISAFILVTFIVNLVLPSQLFAQTIAKVPLSVMAPVVMAPVLSGLTIRPENPLQFDFIVDKGPKDIDEDQLKQESTKLIKYFLASVTIPDDNQWVNLSPYEKEKIIPDDFGSTEMGRDLLLQDYFLKQFTAALNNPEHELGKEFWKRVQDKAHKLFGTRDIPLSTFNKVWIIPDKAAILEKGNTAFILESHLKVMLEEDQLSLNNNAKHQNISPEQLKQVSKISSQIMKEVIVPEIEKEVNSGKTFTNLRQIYNSMILATWYKENLKQSLLNQVYANRSKVKGIDLEDKQAKQKVYQQYLAAFKKGAYNVIKEEYDPDMEDTIYRKYVSGGFARANKAMMAFGFGDLAKLIAADLTRDLSKIPPALLASIAFDPSQHLIVETEFVENQKTTPPAAPANAAPIAAAKSEDKLVWLNSITDVLKEVRPSRLDMRNHGLFLWQRPGGTTFSIPVVTNEIPANEKTGQPKIIIKKLSVADASREDARRFTHLMSLAQGIVAEVSGLEGFVVMEDGTKIPLDSVLSSTSIQGTVDKKTGRETLDIKGFSVRFVNSRNLSLVDFERNAPPNLQILSRQITTYLYSLLVEVSQIPVSGQDKLSVAVDQKKVADELQAVERALSDFSIERQTESARLVLWKTSLREEADAAGAWDRFHTAESLVEEVGQRFGLIAERINVQQKPVLTLKLRAGDTKAITAAIHTYLLEKKNALADVQEILKPKGSQAMMADAVLPTITVANGVANVKINNRTLDLGDVEALITFADEVLSGARKDVKAVVISGGDHFSYGANVYNLLADGMSEDPATRRKPYEFYRREEASSRRMKDLSAKGIPTVTLVRGQTVGGGLGLAAATDFIITDDSSVLAMPEVKIGFFSDVGATSFLANRMGTPAAKYCALTGGSLTGKKAVAMGLAQGYVQDLAGFQTRLEQLIQSGQATKETIQSLIKELGKTKEDLQGEVSDLKANIAKYFNYGQHNQGTVDDIYAKLEEGARNGDEFAQKALAQMRSASAVGIWIADFLIDTFQQDRFKKDPDAARNIEVLFGGDLSTSIWYMEGVAGLKQDEPYVSGKFPSHLDRIVLTDGRGFRVEIKADNIETGSALKADQVIVYQGKEYALYAGDFHAGSKEITLWPVGTQLDYGKPYFGREPYQKGPIQPVTFNLALRNSQWSDQGRIDRLHVIEAMSQTKAGFNILRRASQLNSNKVILDLVNRMPWFKRPHTAMERPEDEDPRTRRYIGGELNASYMALDYWVEQGQGARVIATEESDEVDGAGEPKEIIPVTYNKMLMEAKKMANAFKKQGLKKGDTVVLYMPNSWQTLVAMQACTRLGVIYHPVFAAKKRDVLSDILYELGAKHLITVDAYSVKGNLVQLKRDFVDPVLTQYMSREEFMTRAEKALSGQDASIVQAVRDELQGNVDKKINGIIPEKSTVTKDRRKVIEDLTAKQTERPELADAINLVIAAFNEPVTSPVDKVIVLEKGGPKTRADYKEGRDVKWSEFVAGQEETMLDAVEQSTGTRPNSMDDVISGKTGLGSQKLSDIILKYDSPLEHVDANMPLAVLYTSGTTGKPKGPVITHGNIAAAMAEFPITGQASPEDMFFVAADVGWVTGLVYLGYVPSGNNVPFLIPGFSYSDLERVVRLIPRYGVTIFKAAAGILANMGKNPDLFKKYKADTVKLFISCAAVLSNSSFKQLITLFGKKIFPDLWRTEEEGMKALKVLRDLMIEAASVANNRKALSKILGREVSEKEMQEIVARLRAGYEIGEDRVEILDTPWVSIRFFEAKSDNGDPLSEVREVTETHKVAIDPVTDQPVVDANGEPKMVEDGASVFYEADMMASHAMGSVWKSRRGQKRDSSKPYDIEEDVDLGVLQAKYFTYPKVTAADGRVMHYTGDAATPTRFLEDPLIPGERLGVMYQPNGRDDDVMNINGHRVSSTDMEDPLKAFTEFEEVAVVGVRREGDPRGDSPVVIIKLKKGFQDSPALRQKILTTIGDAIDEQVRPLESDIAFIPADETGIPFTLTGKPMNSLLKYIGRKTTDELRILNLALQDKSTQDKVLAVDVDTLQRLMPGLRNVDTLANPGSFLSVPKAILAARDRPAATEGALPLDRTVPVADPYANVDKGIVARFGEKSLRPGVDPLPRFQEAVVLPRNLDGVTMRGEPKDGLKIMEIPVPKPGPNQIVGQVLYADATYNTINGVTEEPVPVIRPNAPYHGFGDSAVIIVTAIGSEVDKEGRIAVGDIIAVDPSRYSVLDVKDPKEAGYGILGFNVGEGTFRRHVVVDANKAHFPPRGLTLAQVATLALNGGTAFKAVDDVLNVQADDMVKIDGLIATTGEQSGAIADMSGAGVIGFVGDAAKAAQSKTNHPSWIPIVRKDVAALLRKAPRDAEGRKQWLADFAEYVRQVYTAPGVRRPTKSVGFIGAPHFSLAVRELLPGGSHAWFSGAFGLDGTLVGHNAEVTAQEAFNQAGLKSGHNVLVHYGADADKDGVDQKALQAIREAGRRGARVVVLAETIKQKNKALELAGNVTPRMVAIEDLKGSGLEWPDHMPDIDEGRMDKTRPASQPWAGLDKQKRYEDKTLKVIGKAVGEFVKGYDNPNGYFDVVWDNGKRDNLGVSIFVVREQSGVIVYGKTTEDQTLTFSLARGWFPEKGIFIPSSPKDLEQINNPTTEQKFVGILGTHMYEAKHMSRMIKLIEQGALKWPQPARVVPAAQIPQATQEQYLGDKAGATVYRMTSDISPDMTEPRQIMLAQGREIVYEGKYIRMILDEMEPGKKIATIEFFLAEEALKSPRGEWNKMLHKFEQDAVKELRILVDRIKNSADVKGVLLTNYGTRAFLAGQDIKQLQKTPDAQTVERLALEAQSLFADLENLAKDNKPVIWVPNGFALGGGMELGSAAHYSIAVDTSKGPTDPGRIYFSQAEIGLNALPGFGGTQRWVREAYHHAKKTTGNGLAGFRFAADSVMNGQPISVREAADYGLIREVVEANAAARGYELLRGHIDGTDDTLRIAMQARLDLVDNWNQPMADVPADYFDKDKYFNDVILPQAKKTNRLPAINAMRKLLDDNAQNGVQFAAEAKEFGRLMKDLNAGVIGIARELAKQKPELPPKRSAGEERATTSNANMAMMTDDDQASKEPRPAAPVPQRSSLFDTEEPEVVRKERHAPAPADRFSVIDLLGILTPDQVEIARETARTFINDDAAQQYGFVNDANARVDSTDDFINFIDPNMELRNLAAAHGLSVEIVGLNFSFERARKIAEDRQQTTHPSSVIMLDRDVRKGMRILISNTELFLLGSTSKPARDQMAEAIRARFEIALAERSLADEEAATQPALTVFRESYEEIQRKVDEKRAKQPPGLHKGKIVLVSGAAGEMGTDITQRLLDEGATVLLSGRTLTTLNAKIANLKAKGYDISRMRAIPMDNTSPAQVKKGIAKIFKEYGRIDSLLIVAGTTGPVSPLVNSPVGTDKDESVQQGVRNLFVGDILLATEASKIMGVGSSINVVSTIFSRTNYHSRISYVDPKSALRPFFEALGRDLGHQKGIRVNLIYPGGLLGDRISKAWRVMAGNRGSAPDSVAKEFFNRMRIKANYPTFPDVTNAISWILGDEASGVANQPFETTNGMDVEMESATSLFQHLDISEIHNDGEVIMLWGGADLNLLEQTVRRLIKTSPKKIVINLPSREVLSRLQAQLRQNEVWNEDMLQLVVHRADIAEHVSAAFSQIEKDYERADTVIVMPQLSLSASKWSDVTDPADWVAYGDQHVTPSILIARQAMIASAKPDNENAEMKMIFVSPSLTNELAASVVAGTEALVRGIRHEEDVAVHNERKEFPIHPYQLVTNGDSEDVTVVLDHLIALTAKNKADRIAFDEVNLYGPTTKESYRQSLLQRAKGSFDAQKEEAFGVQAEGLRKRQAEQVKFEAGKRLKNKRAVITGAAGENGREETRRYLQEGAKVVLVGRDPKKLQAFKAELLSEGHSADLIQLVAMDLSRREEVERGVGEILKLGKINILVNNAGTSGPKEGVEDLPFGDDYLGENIPQAVANLFTGSWILTQALLPHMEENGSIINVSSIFSLLEYYARIGYVVPKGALNGFSDELSWEVGRSKKIRVNTIFPGPIDTQRIRIVFEAMAKKIGISVDVLQDHFFQMMAVNKGFPKKDEVANVAVFLGSDASGAISGQNFDVTNGMHVDRDNRVTLTDFPSPPAAEFSSGKQTTTVFGKTYEHPLASITKDVRGKKVVIVGKTEDPALENLFLRLSKLGAVVSVVRPETFDNRVTAEADSNLEGAYAIIYANAADDLPEGKLSDISQGDMERFTNQSFVRMLYFAKLASGILRNVTHTDRLKPKVIFLSPRKKSNYAAILNNVTASLVRQMRHDQDIEALQAGAQDRNLTAEFYHVVSTEDDSVEGRSAWVEYLLKDYAGKPTAVNLYQKNAARRLHEPRGKEVPTVKPGQTMSAYYAEFQKANFIKKDTEIERGAMVTEDGQRRVMIITGGSRGIGKATTLPWLLAGGRVAIFARSLDDMKENMKELKAIPEFANFTDAEIADRIMAVSGTIESQDDIERFVRKVVKKWGRIDHLVNNAGAIGPTAPIVREKPGVNPKLVPLKRAKKRNAALDDEVLARFPGHEGIHPLDYEDTFNGNITAALMLSRAALPYLEASRGKIINISTYFSDAEYPLRAPYSMAKAAMDALNDVLREEAMNLGLKHVQIASVHPASVQGTRLQPIEDVAHSWPGLFQTRADASWEIGIAVTAEDIDRKVREKFLEKDDDGKGMFTTEAEVAQAIYNLALSRSRTHVRVFPAKGFSDQRVIVDNNLNRSLAAYVNDKNIRGKVVYILGEVFDEGLLKSIRFLIEKGAQVIINTQTKAALDTLVKDFVDVSVGAEGSLVIENRGGLKLSTGSKRVGELRFKEIIKGGSRADTDEFVRMVKENGASGFKRHLGEYAGTERIDIVISAPLYDLSTKSILDVKNFGTESDGTMDMDEFKRMLREQVIAHAIVARTGIDQILETSRAGAFLIVGPSTDINTPFFQRMNAVFVNRILRQFVLALNGELRGRKVPIKVNSINLSSPGKQKEYPPNTRQVQDRFVATTVLNSVLGPLGYKTPVEEATAAFFTGKIYVKDAALSVNSGSRSDGTGKDRKDHAMLTDTIADIATDTTEVGGIKMDSKLLNLQIKRDGQGVPLPLNLQPIQNMNIEGFAPVILNIHSVNVRFILGLTNEPGNTDYSLDTKPQPYVKPKQSQDLSLVR